MCDYTCRRLFTHTISRNSSLKRDKKTLILIILSNKSKLIACSYFKKIRAYIRIINIIVGIDKSTVHSYILLFSSLFTLNLNGIFNIFK